ncbi:hypothetical protein BJ508DRAFT_412613 [Ascobolus immersus RN42]|uniref:Uncharacterized protein n=1 Tax=Ascobolus immersus RN42 TaxID=1160509 RepID=A0A3N4IEK8_ASCIM|nr:hypothetical protein BJ508DRAFT_412613 [Ascobolus immersus RN42]
MDACEKDKHLFHLLSLLIQPTSADKTQRELFRKKIIMLIVVQYYFDFVAGKNSQSDDCSDEERDPTSRARKFEDIPDKAVFCGLCTGKIIEEHSAACFSYLGKRIPPSDIALKACGAMMTPVRAGYDFGGEMHREAAKKHKDILERVMFIFDGLLESKSLKEISDMISKKSTTHTGSERAIKALIERGEKLSAAKKKIEAEAGLWSSAFDRVTNPPSADDLEDERQDKEFHYQQGLIKEKWNEVESENTRIETKMFREWASWRVDLCGEREYAQTIKNLSTARYSDGNVVITGSERFYAVHPELRSFYPRRHWFLETVGRHGSEAEYLKADPGGIKTGEYEVLRKEKLWMDKDYERIKAASPFTKKATHYFDKSVKEFQKLEAEQSNPATVRERVVSGSRNWYLVGKPIPQESRIQEWTVEKNQRFIEQKAEHEKQLSDREEARKKLRLAEEEAAAAEKAYQESLRRWEAAKCGTNA